ncbi:MAG TPA: polyprenol monophosphomannose synthase [Vicinamibacterales bacterium]|nr:polyprenol monophosphomannose synthase [Vicinamibacterales bacterium]
MKTLVLIPTYNERENLPLLVPEVLAVPGTEVMVIDDQSPDGTGQLAEELAQRFPGRIRVLHRTGRRGLGVSYLDGFRHAVGSDADLVVQMDADRSHDPQYLPAMIAAAGSADLVVGSRYTHGISVVNWPLRRIILSSFANAYIRTVTGLRVRDCTGGYRCWRREALARLPLDRIVSEGYSFVVEVTFLAAKSGLRIAESPIIFIERREGASKLSSGILLESLLNPWRLVIRNGRVNGTESAGTGYNSVGTAR